MSKAQIDLTATDKTAAAFASAQKNLQGLNEQARALPASFGSLGIAIAAAVSVGSLKGIIDGADQLNKLSQKTGIAVESLSELKYAGSLADVSIEAIAKGVKALSTNMFEASTGSKEAAANFALVGVSVKNADGSLRSADDVLADVANTFARLKDGPEKSALAVKLFGKAGMDMIPMLNGGREGLLAMRQEARDLGVVLSAETARAAEEFNDNLTRMSALAGAAAKELTGTLLPSLVSLTNELIEGRKAFGSYWAAFVEIGLKTNPFDTWSDGAKKAQAEVGRLSAEVAKLQTGKAVVGENQGGAAFVGPSGTARSASRLAAAQRELEAAQKRQKYFDALIFKSASGNAAKLESDFNGGGRSTLGLKDFGGGGKDNAAARAANKELQDQVRLLAELSGLTGSFAADWELLNKAYAKGSISLKELTERQEILLSKQPAIKAAAEAEEKLGQIRAKTAELSDKYLSSLIAENDQLAKSNQTLFEEVEAIGLNAEALNMLRLARLDANIAREQELLLVSQGVEGNEAETAQIERRINLLRRERELKAEEGAKEIRAGEIEDNKKRAEGISQSISEGLLDGFRNGKSLADIFLNELKAQFAKTVLQPLITPIVQGGNDALTGALKGGGGGGWANLFGSAAQAAFSGTSLGASGFGSGLAYGNADLGSYLMSFDGGGYTGNGLRAGGLDGKGGFMAMLHPQEDVVDRTKGQKIERGNTVINYHFENGTNRSDLFAAAQQIRALARFDRVEDSRRRR